MEAEMKESKAAMEAEMKKIKRNSSCYASTTRKITKSSRRVRESCLSIIIISFNFTHIK
jgi:hypothetical protein